MKFLFLSFFGSFPWGYGTRGFLTGGGCIINEINDLFLLTFVPKIINARCDSG
jgi:hypothetical protein